MERRNMLKVLGLAAAAGVGFVPDAAEAAEKVADENNYQVHTFSAHQMSRNEIAEVLSSFIPKFRNDRKLVSGKPIEIWFYNEDGSPWGMPDVYGRYSHDKACRFTILNTEPKAQTFETMLKRIERLHDAMGVVSRRDSEITAMVRFFTEPR